jgi:hypothetical protein
MTPHVTALAALAGTLVFAGCSVPPQMHIGDPRYEDKGIRCRTSTTSASSISAPTR